MPTATDAPAEVIGDAQRLSPVQRVAWLLPPFVLALYAVRPLGPIKDPDTYWHIVAGDHLLSTGQFVLDDPFGAAADKVWILNQWLSEVVMHLAYAAYGLAGVAWLLCLGSLLVGMSVLSACRRWASPLPAALVLALVFIALSGSLSPRPQLVTFALTAVTTTAWLLTREDGRARWWLVPLTWVWACSHGMWFMGPLVGGVVVAGMLLERRVPLRDAARLGLVPLLSVAAAAMTPVGPTLFTSPFQVGEVTAYISEWQRPALGAPAVLSSLLLALLVAMGLLRRRRWEWTALLLTLLALSLALMWSRTVGLGAVVLAPLAARALHVLTQQTFGRPPIRERVAVAATGLGCLVVVGVAAPAVATAPALGPNGLDASLAALPTGTILCNDQRDGGWIMLLHPDLRPTMDTRVELYSVDHIRGYLHFVAGSPGWQSYPKRVGCGYAVLPTDLPVVAQMRLSNSWNLVDEAPGYVLFRSSG